jgi:Carboxypeptidase regulatory-like domain
MLTAKFAKESSRRQLSRRSKRSSLVSIGTLFWLSLIFLACDFSALAQSPQPLAGDQSPAHETPGTIYGTVVDQSGAAVADAHVKLTRPDSAANQDTETGDDGQFSFAQIAAGNFELTVIASRFTTKTISGTLHPGEAYLTPAITLEVATVESTVKVTPSQYEVAELQLKEEEQQRVFGFIPNFYVTYVPNAAPLSPKQKFRLALKTMVDPVNIGLVGAAAGIQQASNQFGGYGQGAEGYGKRFGANYADFVTSTFIGSAVLPSLLKQDPRYFYKGTGSVRSRALYAIANAVICKGDNGRWQLNYSAIIGGTLAAGAISNLYYPPHDRSDAGVTFENAGISIAEGAASSLVQEFIVKKLTPNLPNHSQNKP